jgi:hypothetical protein
MRHPLREMQKKKKNSNTHWNIGENRWEISI